MLHALEPTLNHYGYLAVGGLLLLEDFGIPVPGETTLILAAAAVLILTYIARRLIKHTTRATTDRD